MDNTTALRWIESQDKDNYHSLETASGVKVAQTFPSRKEDPSGAMHGFTYGVMDLSTGKMDTKGYNVTLHTAKSRCEFAAEKMMGQAHALVNGHEQAQERGPETQAPQLSDHEHAEHEHGR